MSLFLQVILSAVLLLVSAFLVPLLIQARRTALAVQRFAESAAQDLQLVRQDVHGMRTRVDEVAQLARVSLEHPSVLTQVVAGVASGLRRSCRPPTGPEPWLEALVTGLQSALHWMRGRAEPPQKEGAHE
jgi:cell division protein FtsL